MTKKLYVGNLNYATTETAVAAHFETIGEVVSVNLITDRMTGRSKGFAFVEMAEEGAAQEAINQLNGKEFDGRTMLERTLTFDHHQIACAHAAYDLGMDVILETELHYTPLGQTVDGHKDNLLTSVTNHRDLGDQDRAGAPFGNYADLGEITGSRIGRVFGDFYGDLDGAARLIDYRTHQRYVTTHAGSVTGEQEFDRLIRLQLTEFPGGNMDPRQQASLRRFGLVPPSPGT